MRYKQITALLEKTEHRKRLTANEKRKSKQNNDTVKSGASLWENERVVSHHKSCELFRFHQLTLTNGIN